MSPYESICRFYQDTPPQSPFEWHVNWHMLHGFVYATPEFFVMGRPVRLDAGEEAIHDSMRLFTEEESDCWYCHSFAGDLGRMWSILPWEYKWIAFHRIRDGISELQIMELERLRRLSTHG